MANKIMYKLLVAAGLAAAAVSAQAAQINGILNITGGAYSLVGGSNFTTATGLHWSNAPGAKGNVTATDGDYNNTDCNLCVTLHDFNYNPVNTPISPLWSYTFGGSTYSFDLTSLSVVGAPTPNFLSLQGSGILHITGATTRDDTAGTWVFTGNTTNPNSGRFSFSSTAEANPSNNVPEPATLGLMGLGLVGLAMRGRRRSA